MERYELDDGTVLSLQPAAAAGATEAALAVLFDGRPMIGEGIPNALLALQDDAIIPALTLVCVESIEGSTPRGPSRVASLTDPTILGRFMQSLARFLEQRVALPAEPARRLVLGHSLGGNAALYVACRSRHLFGAVVTGAVRPRRGCEQSASFSPDRRRPAVPQNARISLRAGARCSTEVADGQASGDGKAAPFRAILTASTNALITAPMRIRSRIIWTVTSALVLWLVATMSPKPTVAKTVTVK